MNKEQLWQAMGMIDDELVTNTVEYEKSFGNDNGIRKNVKKIFMLKRLSYVMATIVVILASVGVGKLYIENKAKVERKNMLAELEQYELVEQEAIPNYTIDTRLLESVEEAVNMSSLVIRCKVESVGKPYYESYVDDEIKEQFISDGQKEYTYSNIWQDCVLKVEKVYKGECSKEISYRFLSGDIAAMEGTSVFIDEDGNMVQITPSKGYKLEEGKEYVLFLNYNEEKSIYANSVSPWYVRKDNSTTTDKETEASTNSNNTNNSDSSANSGNSSYTELPTTEEQQKLKKEFKEFADKYYPYDDYDSSYYAKPQLSDNGITYKYKSVENSNVDMFIQYGGKKILWYLNFENIIIYGYDFIEDDIIVYGNVYGGTTQLPERGWMARVSKDGDLIWEKVFDNGYDEGLSTIVVDGNTINAITYVEKDGSRVPEYVTLMQVNGNGEVINNTITDINLGIQKAVKYRDSIYISAITGAYDKGQEQTVIKINADGSYEVVVKCTAENKTYEIKDICVYNDKLYISVNETGKDTVDRDAYEFYTEELFNPINNFADDGYSYFDDDALNRLRKNYTAKILAYDANDNSVKEVYTCDGYMAFELAIRKEQLVWNVQTIEKALYSMATSAYNVVTMNFVYEYIFDMDENLISNEKLKDAVRYSM